MGYANINGKLVDEKVALLPLHTSSFRYGLGLFETMLVSNGAIILKNYHLERLEDGLHALDISIAKNTSLEKEVLRTVQKNGLEALCRVRLQVYAIADALYDIGSNAEFLIECYPLNDSIIAFNENGLVLGSFEDALKVPDKIANYKTTNALIYALAAQKAKRHRWNDALIFNTSGNIIETTIANIFWIKDGIVHSPPLSEGCVAGVMRRHLFQLLPKHGFDIVECSLDSDTLAEADEVFLSNAIRRIKWVRQWNNVTYTCSISSAFASIVYSSF